MATLKIDVVFELKTYRVVLHDLSASIANPSALAWPTLDPTIWGKLTLDGK